MLQPPLSLAKQVYRMSLVWPDLHLRKWKRQAEAAWEGELWPTSLSDRYTVAINLRSGWSPAVRVIAPALEVREGFRSLPHA